MLVLFPGTGWGFLFLFAGFLLVTLALLGKKREERALGNLFIPNVAAIPIVTDAKLPTEVKPNIQSLFSYDKNGAFINVTNSGQVADVWAPMRVEGMMRKKPGDAFARWTHTDSIKTRITKGQTCRLQIAYFQVEYYNNCIAKWIVYSTNETGAGEDSPMSSVQLGNPETQTSDIHIYVDVVSDPDNASGIKKHHIALHSREAEEII